MPHCHAIEDSPTRNVSSRWNNLRTVEFGLGSHKTSVLQTNDQDERSTARSKAISPCILVRKLYQRSTTEEMDEQGSVPWTWRLSTPSTQHHFETTSRSYYSSKRRLKLTVTSDNGVDEFNAPGSLKPSNRAGCPSGYPAVSRQWSPGNDISRTDIRADTAASSSAASRETGRWFTGEVSPSYARSLVVKAISRRGRIDKGLLRDRTAAGLNERTCNPDPETSRCRRLYSAWQCSRLGRRVVVLFASTTAR